jgi:hypothetical protein
MDTPGLPTNHFDQRPILAEIEAGIHELGHIKMFALVITNSSRLTAFFDTLEHII